MKNNCFHAKTRSGLQLQNVAIYILVKSTEGAVGCLDPPGGSLGACSIMIPAASLEPSPATIPTPVPSTNPQSESDFEDLCPKL